MQRRSPICNDGAHVDVNGFIPLSSSLLSDIVCRGLLIRFLQNLAAGLSQVEYIWLVIDDSSRCTGTLSVTTLKLLRSSTSASFSSRIENDSQDEDNAVKNLDKIFSKPSKWKVNQAGLTTTRPYATTASMSTCPLKATERMEKTPPRVSIVMKVIDMPFTSPSRRISTY